MQKNQPMYIFPFLMKISMPLFFCMCVILGPLACAVEADSALMEKGRAQFMMCAACHGKEGEGTAAAPPLAGSEWVAGPVENLIRIQLRGLRGLITVKGRDYDFPAGMAPMAYQNDAQIAAVLTYVRQSFGNSASPVDPSQVAALRSEVGKPQLVVSDLTPLAKAESSSVSPTAPSSPSGKYANLETEEKMPKWLVVAVVVLLAGVGMWLAKSRND